MRDSQNAHAGDQASVFELVLAMRPDGKAVNNIDPFTEQGTAIVLAMSNSPWLVPPPDAEGEFKLVMYQLGTSAMRRTLVARLLASELLEANGLPAQKRILQEIVSVATTMINALQEN